ncbi:hypothetical protein JQS43_04785 [Natronosporangium hydrolyticum]|uniref:Bacteriocin biosynthesis cyclodehydratase domain-containing protein n=1 Tax=Natronosporangium hydrolyticum TaxID=2811111 RepID=A0A895YI14_9ACTN|nr:hypothetical protein [Natronosporangium hydrolyticum]QSB15665.1 hypothetical protein JQS43_04785 [Natronosporangium hydrolyticum]
MGSTSHTAAVPSPSSASLPRPTLLPGLRRIWRGTNRLQLGTDPARAVVLDLPNPAVARLLDLLDGGRSQRSVLTTAAQRYGVAESDALALLNSLTRAGLLMGAQALLPNSLPATARRRLTAEASALALRRAESNRTPAQLLRRRAAARVLVTGYGPLAAPVAVALAQAGVGHVAPSIVPAPTIAAPAKVPERRPPARGTTGLPAPPDPAAGGPPPPIDPEIAESITRAAPDTRTWAPRRRDTSLVVQVGGAGPANLIAEGYARHRLAHLAIGVRDAAAVIGPFVPPTGGPCLNCLDLHRRDRDPEWPEVASQLAQPANEPCSTATILTAAGFAVGEALCWLDGGTPGTLGASLEIVAPGQPRRRSWPPHPECACFDRYLRSRPRPVGASPQ